MTGVTGVQHMGHWGMFRADSDGRDVTAIHPQVTDSNPSPVLGNLVGSVTSEAMEKLAVEARRPRHEWSTLEVSLRFRGIGRGAQETWDQAAHHSGLSYKAPKRGLTVRRDSTSRAEKQLHVW